MYPEISKPMDYRAALYIRLSKEDDREKESESVSNQRSLLLDYAEKQGLSVADTYIDDGYSGTNFDRPAFKRMITDIHKGLVNMVLTKDMSRLGRDYIQTGYYMERFFPENRVRYISLLDGIDTGSDSSINDITPFKAIMNDMYAKDISKKISSVKRDKQKKGLFIGGKAPYGYVLSSVEKNKIEIDEIAATIVRKMFQLAKEGKSCRQIAQLLNDNKVPPPSKYANLNLTKKGPFSGLWSSERVSAMLKNEIYIGNMVQGKRRKINYKTKKSLNLPPEEWMIVKDTHEALIDQDTFDCVQIQIASRNHVRSTKHDYFLKGLVHCHECGYPLGVIRRVLAGNRPTLYFICRTYQRFTKEQRCSCHCVKVDLITEAVLGKIKELCQQYVDPEELSSIVKQTLVNAGIVKNRDREIEQIQRQIQDLGRQLDRAYADKLKDVLDEDDFDRFYRAIKLERNELRKEEERLSAIAHSRKSADEQANLLVGRFLDEATTNRELIVSLVERIEISKDKEILIFFRFKQIEACMFE